MCKTSYTVDGGQRVCDLTIGQTPSLYNESEPGAFGREISHCGPS